MMTEGELLSFPDAPPGALLPGAVIGVLGGGQLARMMAPAAARLGYKLHVYSDQTRPCAADLSFKTTCASYHDLQALQRFTRDCAVITFEFEHFPDEALQALEHCGVPVRPGPHAVYLAKHRLREKDFARSAGLTPPPYASVRTQDELSKAYRAFGEDCILKSVTDGYDGKGQVRLYPRMDDDSLAEALASLKTAEACLEQRVPFVQEISVTVARGADGTTAAFEIPENRHREGILRQSIVPGRVAASVKEQAKRDALTLAERLDYTGVMCVEFFVTEDGRALFNEFAPRPHNSAHWSIDACISDQFEQHIRAVAGLPLGDPALLCPAVMTNILGEDRETLALGQTGGAVKLHLYGKSGGGAGRKNGHVTQLCFKEELELPPPPSERESVPGLPELELPPCPEPEPADVAAEELAPEAVTPA